MTTLTFEYAGYEYTLTREGNRYTAHYEQHGERRSKYRVCPNCWLNGDQRPVKDAGMIAELETRVRQLQSLTTPKGPRPLPVMHAHEQPRREQKGHKSRREGETRREN